MMDRTCIPIHGRGGKVICHALVDQDDYARLSGFRWHLNSGGVVVRNCVVGTRPTQRTLARDVLQIRRQGPPRVVHRNRNPLDCRKANLTLAESWLGRIAAGSEFLQRAALQESGVLEPEEVPA